VATTRLTCSEIDVTSVMLIPLSPLRQKLSPLSFNSTRLYARGAPPAGDVPSEAGIRCVLQLDDEKRNHVGGARHCGHTPPVFSDAQPPCPFGHRD